jgi:hypothetical protein
MVLYVMIGPSQKRTIQYWSSGYPVFIFPVIRFLFLFFFCTPYPPPFMYCAFVCLPSMYNEYTINFFYLLRGGGGRGGWGVGNTVL